MKLKAITLSLILFTLICLGVERSRVGIVNLQWDQQPDTNRVGTYLYWGRYPSTNYDGRLLVTNGTAGTITNLTPGKWLFTATSLARNGIESDYAREVLFDLTQPNTPTNLRTLWVTVTVQTAQSVAGPWQDSVNLGSVPFSATNSSQFYRVKLNTSN